MSVTNPERVVTKQDLADFYNRIFPYLGGARILSQTLVAGNTSVTFTTIPTTGDNLINFYTSTGINYTAIDTSIAGQVTLTFDSQLADVVVKCEIKEIG